MEEEKYRKVTPVEKSRGSAIDDRDKVVTPTKKTARNGADFKPIFDLAMKEIERKQEEEKRRQHKSFRDTVYDLDENTELDKMLQDEENTNSIEDQMNIMNSMRRFR